MTTVGINDIGLCAHFSEKGDWAFDFAFRIARESKCQLNIFYFLRSPYEKYSEPPGPPRKVDDKILVQTDRRVREYYDKCLGEFVDVGFKVCEESRHAKELRTCLMHREYQLLVIPYLERTITFGNMPIEEFAFRFQAPVVLVGPDKAEQYFLNPPAVLIADNMSLEPGSWQEINEGAGEKSAASKA